MATKKLKKVNGWPDPHGLTHDQLAELVMQLQGILWASEDSKPDPDKAWTCSEIEEVSEALSDYGLKP
jgi:hypothetical protein